MNTAAAESVGFAITAPELWFELDLHPVTRAENIRRLVYERVREQPELRDQRAAIVRLLEDFAQRATASGAVYSSAFVQPSTDGPITGSLTISIVDGPADVGGAEPDPVRALLERLTPRPRGADGVTWLDVAVVDLADYGPVARTSGVEDLQLPDGSPVRVVTMQTFVPLPAVGPGRRVALVSASSPVLWLAEELLDLFDAVTSTFRLVRSA